MSSSIDQELRDKIIETHTDVKNLVKNFDAHVIEDRDYQKKTNQELETLKSFRWKVAGGVLVAVFAVDFLLKTVFK